MSGLRRWVAAALVGSGLATGFLLGFGPRSAPRTTPNVVLVLVDTLRADATSLHGYARDTTPFLRELAREGVRFDRARAQSSCTFPSVNSILSGRSPAHFLGQKPRGSVGLLPRLPTVQEVFRSHGYRTLAVSASTVVRATPSKHNSQGGFGQGFDEFDENCLQERASCVTERALQLLPSVDLTRRPYFLYLHYLDPHSVYDPPKSLEGTFTTTSATTKTAEPQVRRWVRDGNLDPLVDALYRDGPPEELTAVERTHIRGLYDEEVLAVDQAVQALVEGLRRRGDWERTFLVLVGDHGEEFLEHGGIHHCRTTWDEVLRTPMLWVGPGLEPGVVDRPVSNLDVMPTLLSRMGFDASRLGLEGEDLFRALRSESGDRETWSFAIQDRWRSVTGPRFKLVFDIRERSARLFDLEADPGETVDVAEREREALRLHWRALERHLAATEGGVGSRKTQEAMDETMRQLRALGYL